MTNRITQISGTNSDGTDWTLTVGDCVAIEADECDPDSADQGYITAFVDAETARVFWDSGVETPVEIARLTSV